MNTNIWRVANDKIHLIIISQDLVNRVLASRQFQQPFKSLVYFQRHKAYADVCFYPSRGKMEHRSDIQSTFRDTERPFHIS